MTNRASTRTTLAFGTVRAPVALFRATSDPEPLPAFEKASPDGKRLELNVPANEPKADAVPAAVWDALEDSAAEVSVESYLAPKAPFREVGTGREVARENVRSGIFRGDEFVDLTERLAEIDEATHLDELDVVGTILSTEVPRHRVRGAYYVGSDGPGGLMALHYLYAGLRKSGRLAVVELTKRSRQTLGVIAPYNRPVGHVLILLELARGSEVREAPERAKLDAATVTPEGVGIATELVKVLTSPASILDELKDDAVVYREDLIAAAKSGDLLPRVGRVASPSGGTIEDELAASVEILR